MKSQEYEPKGKIIHDDSKVISTVDIIQAVFSMSFEELIRDIKKNDNGKYDHLYQNKEGIRYIG